MNPAFRSSSGWSRHDVLALLLVLAAVAFVHGRALQFEFLGHGDPRVVTQNAIVLRGVDASSITAAFTSFERGLYQPLAVMAHAIDVQLFGMHAGAHHAGNVALHALNAVLVGWILLRATGRRPLALVVALGFAMHPLQVQSVAWVSERGGLLAVTFGLLALERYASAARDRRARVLAHLFFGASLLAKPVFVPLPLVLMAWDRWPLGRTESARARWREKRGYFALAAAAAILTVVAHVRASALASLDEVGVVPRLLNAAVAYGRTLRRLVWPDDLAAVHPFRFDVSVMEASIAAFVSIVAIVFAWRTRERWPFVFTGITWWALLLLPTVQLVQFGQESTADRFSYAPVLGLVIVVVTSGARLLRGRLGGVIAAAAIVACAATSVRALAPWKDTVSLFTHSLEVTGGSAPVHLQLSVAHRARGDLPRALSHAHEALRYAPHSARVLFQLADLLRESGNFVAAYDRYTDGLLIDPENAAAYASIGELQLARGNLDEAGRSFHRGMQVAPGDARVILGMAEVMGRLGRRSDRLVLLQRALEADPTRPGLRREIAWSAMTDSIPGAPTPDASLRLAEIEWEDSGRADPLALEAMAAALARMGRMDEARQHATRAERLAREQEKDALAEEIRARRALYLPVEN